LRERVLITAVLLLRGEPVWTLGFALGGTFGVFQTLRLTNKVQLPFWYLFLRLGAISWRVPDIWYFWSLNAWLEFLMPVMVLLVLGLAIFLRFRVGETRQA